MKSDDLSPVQGAILGYLVQRQSSCFLAELVDNLGSAGVERAEVETAVEQLVGSTLLKRYRGRLELTTGAHLGFLEWQARLQESLELPELEGAWQHCPSLPWLTTVQTEWQEALSINYSVEPEALAALLPPPLVPEISKGRAWVQVLISALRDMRPQGLGSLFGVSFYQISYRAQVEFTHGAQTYRGGYFVRSETNNELMRAVGNKLTEFKFHDFGLANMLLLRSGNKLSASVDPKTCPGGALVAAVTTSETAFTPETSVWNSLEELQVPLVDCYDAFAVAEGYVYALTIDRDPWNASFAQMDSLYCEYFAEGPLRESSSYDSVLYIPRCGYRWLPLKRLKVG